MRRINAKEGTRKVTNWKDEKNTPVTAIGAKCTNHLRQRGTGEDALQCIGFLSILPRLISIVSIRLSCGWGVGGDGERYVNEKQMGF